MRVKVRDVITGMGMFILSLPAISYISDNSLNGDSLFCYSLSAVDYWLTYAI